MVTLILTSSYTKNKLVGKMSKYTIHSQSMNKEQYKWDLNFLSAKSHSFSLSLFIKTFTLLGVSNKIQANLLHDKKGIGAK